MAHDVSEKRVMKQLNVKWVPDTFAIFSLGVDSSPETLVPAPKNGQAHASSTPANAVPRTRLIVISEQGKLKADVITEQVNSPGSVPELVEVF
jgi:hypothetical protein